jgi:hypothetical protein
VLLEGVTFDHWNSVLEQLAADGGSVSRLRLFDIRVVDSGSIPVNIEVPVTNYWIRGCAFDGIASVAALRIGRNTHSEQDTWTGGNVTDVFIRNIDVPGDEDGVGAIFYGKDTRINGVLVDGMDATGTGELAGLYNKLRYSSVSGSTVKNLDGASASVWAFNHKGTDRSLSSSPNGHSNVYYGNIAVNIEGTGGGGYGHRHQQEGFVSFGHIAEACSGTSYSIDYSEDVAGVTNGLLFGFIARNATAAATVGVRVSTCLSNVAVENFIVQNHFIGVRLSSTRADVGDWRVANGVISVDASTGQCVAVRRDNDINGLDLIGLNCTEGSVGVRFEAGSGVLSDVRVLDNNLNGTTAQLSGTLPADVEIRHCWKFVTTAAGPTTALTLELADAAVYSIELKALAILDNDATENNSYHVAASYFRDGGGATLKGSVKDIETAEEVTAAWNATLTASGNNVLVALTGEASHTINWKLWIHVLGASA